MAPKVDIRQATIESARWYILLVLDAGRPIGASEDIIQRALDDSALKLTQAELRRELDYLRDRKLIELKGEDTDHWHAELTAAGVDLVEYTVECRPGIARPPKR